jgi:TonB-linked SusC/RagA family outer membrane protein
MEQKKMIRKRKKSLLSLPVMAGAGMAVKRRMCTLLLALLCAPASLWAQDLNISGTVLDGNSEPLAGVSVVVKGSTRGVSTGAGGDYSIQAPADATLVFSFMGMTTREEPVGGRGRIDVTLSEDNKALAEVVVIGYGIQRREAVTGSVASMSSERIREVPSGNIAQALQGRMPGVQMSQTSSRPGAEMRIRIRGTRSLNASNDPLVVLDGIPFAGSLGDINPNDIKSIDILKDASATAIYGSRGANGVILVTSNKGQTGQQGALVSYNGYVGVKNVFAKFPMMDGPTFEAYRQESLNNGAAWTYSGDEKPGTNTDWQELFYQTGMVNSHDVAVSGGMDRGSYSFGSGYYKESTVIPGQEYTRFSLKGSAEKEVKRFKFGFITQNAYGVTENETSNPLYDVLALSPLIDPYNADGSLKHQVSMGTDPHINPLETEGFKENGDQVQTRKTFSSYNTLTGEVALLDGLKYHVNVGLNYRKSDYGAYNGLNTFVPGTNNSNATVSTNLTTNWAVEHLLYYDKTFADKHILNAVVMYSAEQTTYNSSEMSALDVPADYMQYFNIGLTTGTKTIDPANQSYWQRGLTSLMARAAYNYDNRYMLSATLRHDESSVLAEGKQGHTYPAVSAGWNIKNESFMQEVTPVNMLKLRVGYGETSNQAVNPYATRGGLGINYYNFGDNNQYGYYVNTLPNNNLGWEYSTTWNFGLDFVALSNRLTGTVEYYVQNTNDILLQLSLPRTSGVDGSYWANIGKTQNKGVELSLSYAILQNLNGWDWDFGLNFYSNRNKIVELASGLKEDTGNGWFVGSPIDVVYDYKKTGIWQLGEEAQAALYEGTAGGVPGVIKVEYTGEHNADGTPARLIGEDDRQILSSIEPDFEGGFNTRVAYKGFDLNVVGIFKSGGTLVSSIHATSSYLNLLTGRRNNVDVNYWTESNPTNDYPGVHRGAGGDNALHGSTLAYFDASYLKVRAITLGYNFSSSLLKKVGLSNARVYATVQNPFVLFSPYHSETGLDPETNSPARDNQAVGNNSMQPSRQLTVAYNTPATRNWLFGINFSF